MPLVKNTNLMKYTIDKIIPILGRVILTLVIAIGLFLFLQDTQEYSYFYREQNQLFLWDADVIGKTLLPIGGFCKVLTQILVQFFVLPKMGAFISVVLCLIGAHFLWNSLKNLAIDWWLAPLVFVPFAVANVYLLDNYAHYEFLVALVLMSFFFWLYTLAKNLNLYVQVGIGAIFTLLLYYLAGSIAILLGAVLLVYELLLKQKKGLVFVLPYACVLFAGLLAVNQAWLVNLNYAYGMQYYVEHFFEPTGFYKMAWYATLALVPVFWLVGKLKLKNLIVQAVAGILLAFLVPFCYSFLAENHQDKGMYSLERFIHYADTEQWNEIIARGHTETNNYISLNYLNLALSKKGQLMDRLFDFNQSSSQAVFLDYQQYTDIGVLRARQYYQIGAIGASQMNAVSAKMSVSDGSPSMEKLIIKNYIITGRYNIAEKYIQEMEKTWYYADWATSMRKYLNNDKAVEEDPELGMKRKDLPLNNEDFTIYAGIYNDAQTVMNANPEETAAADYAMACMLLDKNFNYLIPFAQFNLQNGYWKELPTHLQEAILTASEQDNEKWQEFKISEEMIAKFAQFRQDALNLRHSGGSVSQLAPKYGNTFWYYMLKNNKK